MLPWIYQHYVELLGTAFSIAYLYFSIKQNILLWPLGIISAIFYLVVFYQSKFYADMALNGYYLVISIYGWIIWRRAREKMGMKMPITRLNLKLGLVLIIVTGILYFVIGKILYLYTDSPIPYWDAFTTSASIVATWMLAKKILEHWIIWVIVDLVSMGLYIYRGLYPTTFLFAVYTTMAVIGFIQWRKELLEY